MVAGAGIAGSCVARALRERGHDVTVADGYSQSAASRCAFAFTRTAWWTGDQRTDVRAALAWYGRHGWLVDDSAEVKDLRRGRTVRQGDHYLVDPLGPLVDPDVAQHVTAWKGAGHVVAVTLADGTRTETDALVLSTARSATGASRALTYGGVWEAPGRHLAGPGPLALLRVTDRLSHTAAWDGTFTRVGASKASTASGARQRAERILSRMCHEGLVDPEAPWVYREGVRYTPPAGPAACEVEPRVWALTGFGRSGYSTAPAAAQRLAARLAGEGL
ncbi:FAD/NAD(P)-binding protein [Streptomyces africanus]|uniref:FAD/NAD(P)-binding protein n=1 Tax=Streptomyces africanus TaxID=231024 RepID=UPI0031345367